MSCAADVIRRRRYPAVRAASSLHPKRAGHPCGEGCRTAECLGVPRKMSPGRPGLGRLLVPFGTGYIRGYKLR